MVPRMMRSRIERRPRAPVLRLMARSAIASRAAGSKTQLDVLHLEELAVLLGQRIAGLGQDADHGLAVQLLQTGHHRQAADQFGDQAVLHEILRLDQREELLALFAHRVFLGAGEAERVAPDPAFDDLFEPLERAAADEQDVARVDLEVLLLRVLAPALRRHVGHRALEDLQQRLLHAFARHVARDRRVAALAADLVDLVDVDDALFGRRDVVVGGLQQPDEDILHVLADVAGFGQRRGVGDGERHVQVARQRLRQQRLARAGAAEHQDVALVDLDAVAGDLLVDPLVVVVDRHRQADLGVVLADHVQVEVVADLARLGELRRRQRRLVQQLAFEDVVAELDALAADVDARRPGDQLGHLVLSTRAERALDHLWTAVLATFHPCSPTTSWTTPVPYFFFALSDSISLRLSMTLSTMP